MTTFKHNHHDHDHDYADIQVRPVGLPEGLHRGSRRPRPVDRSLLSKRFSEAAGDRDSDPVAHRLVDPCAKLRHGQSS